MPLAQWSIASKIDARACIAGGAQLAYEVGISMTKVLNKLTPKI